MKKFTTLLGAALSIAMIPAFAQTNIQVIGTVDLFAGSLKNSGDSDRLGVVNSGGMTTSYFGFKGTEDLGQGMKAEIILTGFFRADTGASGRNASDNMFSRDSNIGISGAYGRFQLGRTVAPSFLPLAAFNPFGASFSFSPLILHGYVSTGPAGSRNWTAANASDNGWSNQLVYTSPTINGFKTNIHYQFGENTGSSGSRNVGVNVFYTKGLFEMAGFMHDAAVSNPNSGNALIDSTISPINYGSINRQKAYFIGGAYTVLKAKLFATYQINNSDANSAKEMKDKVYSLGMSLPVSSGAFLLGYARTNRTGSLISKELHRDTLSVGYDHFITKRVDIYTIVKLDKITASETATSFGTGIRYNF